MVHILYSFNQHSEICSYIHYSCNPSPRFKPSVYACMCIYLFHSPKSLFSTHQLRATHKALLSFHNVNHSPILWPVACPISLVQPDETAKNFGHHSGCISDMESQALLIKQTDPIISCFMLYKTRLFIIHAFTLTKLLLQFLLEVQKNPLNIC